MKQTVLPQDVPAVAIRDLNFSYDGLRPILTHVHLTLAKGSFTAIVGPNGSGKTTLLRLILGLLTPDTGVVEVFGERAGHGSRQIGYVPQYTASRPDFPVTVMEIVLMGLRPGIRGFVYSKKERDLAAAALSKAGIEEGLFSRRMDRLSGGQRQRVIIARALVGNPDLLVFDEPTSNIDPEGRFCFFELMDKLKSSLTIIVVSHDLSIVASRVTDIACVNKRLIHSDTGAFTREMLSLLYGAHEHSCPMADYLEDVSTVLNIPTSELADD
ncbi:metal ABC transporter ATP-binding protein [Desulfoplanes sp.]